MALVPGEFSSLCLRLWAAGSASLSGTGQGSLPIILSLNSRTTFKTPRNYRVENWESFLTCYQGKLFI